MGARPPHPLDALTEPRLAAQLVRELPTGAVHVRDGRLELNPAAEALLGRSTAEVPTLDALWRTVYGDRGAEVRALYEADRDAGFPAPRTFPLDLPDGTRRWIEFSGSLGKAGEVWVLHDVTARVELERRYRLLARNLPHAAVVVVDADLETRLVEGEAPPPADWALLRRHLERALAGHRVRTRAEDPDGRVLDLTVVPLRDETDAVVGAQAVAQDVTEADRAERHLGLTSSVGQLLALAAPDRDLTQAVLHTLVDGLGAGLACCWLPGEDGRLRLAHAAAARPAVVREVLDTAWGLALGPADGLLGRVFAGEPAAVVDELDDPRGEAAAACGLQGSAAVPMTAAGGVVGVLELLCQDGPRGDALRTLQVVADQLAGHQGRVAVHRRLTGERRRYEVLAEQAPVGISHHDAQGQVVWLNAHLAHLCGRPAAELLGDRWPEVVHPDDRERVTGVLGGAIATGQEAQVDLRALHPDGTVLWLESALRPLRDEHGDVVGFLGTSVDITERRTAEDAARAAEAAMARMLEAAPIGMAVGELDGTLAAVNDAFCRLSGRPAAELAGRPFHVVLHPDDVEDARHRHESLVLGDVTELDNEQRWLRPDGETRWVSVRSILLPAADGRPDRTLSQVVDVTAQHDVESRLRDEAERDALTGLANRRVLHRELAAHCARARRYGATGALLLLDLDGFKAVNDTDGHVGGDALLVQVADILRGELRAADVIARFGGDEFAALLPAGGAEEALVVAGKLREALATRIDADPATPAARGVTCSVGVAAVLSPVPSADVLLARADDALYAAKAAGRDAVWLHEQPPPASA